MTALALSSPEDAHRMAAAGYYDGMDDTWHRSFAASHGAQSPQIYAALKAGRAQARADDAAYLASLETKPPAP
jgi:uncharacterized protein YhjY with autotransporter beta-barrel domain